MKTTIAVLALLGFANAATLRQYPSNFLEREGPSDFFENAQTYGEKMAHETEVRSAQEEYELHKLADETRANLEKAKQME